MSVHSMYECVLSCTLSPLQYRILLCSPGGLELCSSSHRLLSAEITGMPSCRYSSHRVPLMAVPECLADTALSHHGAPGVGVADVLVWCPGPGAGRILHLYWYVAPEL